MVKRIKFNNRYWRYYIMLEEKFIKTERYVEIAPGNYNAFSNEYANLLISIGAEADELFKMNCGIEHDERATINDYVMLKPEIEGAEVEILNREIDNIKPFYGWDNNQPAKSLTWWSAYNAVKHNRGDNRQEASMKNVLYALAALCVLENYMLKRIAVEYNCMDVPSEYSRLFYIKGWKYNSGIINKHEKDIYISFDEDDESDRKLLNKFEELGWDDLGTSLPEE